MTKKSALLLGALAALPAILLLLPLSEQSPLVQRQHPAPPRAAPPPLERVAEPPTEEVRSVRAAAPAGGVDRSIHAEPLPTASTPARRELHPPNPQLRPVPAMSALPVPSRRAPDATDRPVLTVGAERTRAPMLSPAAIPPLETSPSHTEAVLLPAQGASQPPLAAPLALAAPSASSIIIAPAAAPAPPGATATRVLAPKQGPAAAAPTLADAQPEITRLLHTMESGSGDQLLLLLQQDARNAPGAQALSRQYDRLAQGARPVRMSHADFTSRARDGVLIVTGRVRLHAGEATIGPTTQTLSWSAEFAQRDGRVQLINLTRLPD